MAEQQIIQNPSVTPGSLKIELSGGYVTAISGHPVGGTGGGGGPSVVYTGVEGEINVNNQQGTIGLADAVKEQLSSIPSKVSDLSDSANYYTKEQVDHEIDIIDYTQIGGLVGQLDLKQDKLTFGYDDSAISSINGSAIAGQNDMSQYALKNDLDVVSGEVDILTDTSAKWNEVSAKFDTSSWNAYSGKFQLSGDYATKSDLDLYYKKTETSSKDEISDAIKDFITDADVTAKKYLTEASGNLLYPKLPNEMDTGIQYAYTKDGWAPIQGAGDVSGITVVNRDNTLTGDGNTVKLGIDLTATMNLTNTTAKSASSADKANSATNAYSATLATKAMGSHTEYTLGSTLDTMSNITATIDTSLMSMTGYNGIERQIDETTHYATAFGLTDSAYAAVQYVTANSGNWDKVSDKLDTTAAAQTYQTKADMSGYSTKTDLQNVSAGVDAVSGELVNYYKKSETSAAGEISTALGDKVDKPSSTLQNKYLVLRTTSGGSVDGWVDLKDNFYSKSEADGRYIQQTFIDNTLSGTGTNAGNKLGVNTNVIQTKLTDEQLSAISEVSSKLDRADLADYVPYSATKLAIGSNNDISENNSDNTFTQGTNNKVSTSPYSFVQGVSNSAVNSYSLAQGYANYAQEISLTQGSNNNAITVSFAQGQHNTAKSYSIAQGTQNSADITAFAQGSANKARYDSFAQGNRNSAFSQSLAQGNYNSADEGSLAQGKHNTAYSHSFAQGSMNYADNNALAQGGDNTAKYFSQALGFGLSIQGSRGTTDGTDYISGGLAIGTYNQTSADVAFVVGNGHSNGADVEPTRSDAFLIYPDGRVSAAGNISANGVELGAGGGSLTLPVNVGTGNDVSQISAIGAIGNNCSAGTKSFAFSYKGATASNNSFAVNDDNIAVHNSFAWGWANTADNYSIAGGNATSADEHSFALGNAVYTKYWTLGVGRGLEFIGDSDSSTGIGALVAGGWNKTTSNAIFVLGNGTGNGSYRRDAVVVDRSGNTKIYGSLTVDVSGGNNVLAVASAATLIGASRQTSEHYGVDTTALGTTWVGVGGDGMHQGFIKYTDGGDVGALNTTSTIQINIKPENAGYNGEMTITNVNGATTTQSKVVNVPTASYNSMSSFDDTNGPNYMLRKTASGFDIGAAVINVTSLPQQTEANAYYFVYDT